MVGAEAPHAAEMFHGYLEAGLLFAILLIVGVHHLFSLCYELLHWPQWLVTFIERRKQHEVMSVLDALGIGTKERKEIKERAERTRLRKASRIDHPRARCVQLLKPYVTKGHFLVGKSYTWESPFFVDAMAACADGRVAEQLADVLTTYVTNQNDSFPVFSKVVGMKDGCPILASKFAERLSKEMVLYRGKADFKFNRRDRIPATLFDGSLERDDTVMLVDDSTTGAARALDCIDALEAMGCKVCGFVILFEPLGKNARSLLHKRDVPLHAVITLDSKGIRELVDN